MKRDKLLGMVNKFYHENPKKGKTSYYTELTEKNMLEIIDDINDRRQEIIRDSCIEYYKKPYLRYSELVSALYWRVQTIRNAKNKKF